MHINWMAAVLCAGAAAASVCTLCRQDKKADLGILASGLLLAGTMAVSGAVTLGLVLAAASLLVWKVLRSVAACRSGIVVERRESGFGFGAVFLAVGLLVAILVRIVSADSPAPGAARGIQKDSLVAPVVGVLVLLYAGLNGIAGILYRGGNR